MQCYAARARREKGVIHVDPHAGAHALVDLPLDAVERLTLAPGDLFAAWLLRGAVPPDEAAEFALLVPPYRLFAVLGDGAVLPVDQRDPLVELRVEGVL